MAVVEFHIHAGDDSKILEALKLMTQALERLTASVTAMTTVIASAEALLGTLADEIRSHVEDGDTDALNALADTLDRQRAELASAITANTIATNEHAPASDTVTAPASDIPLEAGEATAPAPATDEAVNEETAPTA